jgi:hypothetical protein
VHDVNRGRLPESLLKQGVRGNSSVSRVIAAGRRMQGKFMPAFLQRLAEATVRSILERRGIPEACRVRKAAGTTEGPERPNGFGHPDTLLIEKRVDRHKAGEVRPVRVVDEGHRKGLSEWKLLDLNHHH